MCPTIFLLTNFVSIWLYVPSKGHYERFKFPFNKIVILATARIIWQNLFAHPFVVKIKRALDDLFSFNYEELILNMGFLRLQVIDRMNVRC